MEGETCFLINTAEVILAAVYATPPQHFGLLLSKKGERKEQSNIEGRKAPAVLLHFQQ